MEFLDELGKGYGLTEPVTLFAVLLLNEEAGRPPAIYLDHVHRRWLRLPPRVREAAASAYVLAEGAPLDSFGGRGGGVAAAYEVLLAYAQRVP